MLLSGAALFTRHLSNLRNVDLGFERQSVLLVTIDPSHAGERNQLAPLVDQLLERMQAIAGVRSATLSAVTPIEGPGAARMVNVEGFQEKPDDRRFIPLNWVAPRYFETFGTPVLGGRDFQREDESRPRVAIVNDAFARYYFAGRSPIGGHFTFDGNDRVYEIVGVVGTAKYQDLTETPLRTIYLNALQEGRGTWQKFALRTAVPPVSIAGDVRRTVRDTLKPPDREIYTLTEQWIRRSWPSAIALFSACSRRWGSYRRDRPRSARATQSRGAPTRSASAWRSARRPAMSRAW